MPLIRLESISSADNIAFTPSGDIVATDVQAAIEELDAEKLAKADNLSDVAAPATAFTNIKQDATESATGVLEIATDAEFVAQTETDKAVVPSNMAVEHPVVGTTGIFSGIVSFANDVWARAKNFAGTDYINMFKVNVDDEIETGATLITGSIEAVEDAGAITVFDMPVSSTPSAGDEMSATYKIDGDNILTVGAEADGSGGIQNPKVVAHCGLNLKEITTPTAKADYGAWYTKADNNFYFQDGAGVEHEVSVIGNHYAEMYLNNNGNATVIETADTPIALRQFTVGSLDGWTFNAGSTGAITAYADGTGKVNVSSAAHGLVTGDIITIRGTTNYNGVWEITKINDGSFSIPDTWVADDGASDWDEGSHLIASVGSAGAYAMSWDISASEAGGAGSHVKIVVYINTTADPKGIARRKCANNDQRCASGQSLLTIADGDKVYTTIESTGTNDITAQYGNITLRRR